MAEKRKNEHRTTPRQRMPWAMGIALGLIAIGLFALGVVVGTKLTTNAVVAAQPTGSINQNFTVDARQEWQDTGITISQDDVVSITYESGQWRIDPLDALHGADGGSSIRVCAEVDCIPVPDYPKGGLIGRIGSGQAFVVGSQYKDLVTNSGTLQLRANDVGIDDNEGSVTVHISVQHIQS
jgi:hypothetical protein